MNITSLVAEAGIVGCGGAGFPTHVKLKPGFEYFIINGAECEPLLRNDRYLMRAKAQEIVYAAASVAKELNIPNVVIALKKHYEKETAALEEAIKSQNAQVRLCLMDSFYPAGDEQTIVYEVTGRVVPPAGLPGEVGCVVDNVATVYAIYEAMQGRPLTKRYLTVTGEVAHPCILLVPVGTPFTRCIELAGGSLLKEYHVVSGGPMMGKPVYDVENAVVTKTTSGILVLPKDCYHANTNAIEIRHMLNRARSACIQCSTCTQMCPRHMLGHPIEPHRIMRKAAVSTDILSMLDDPDVRNAQLCCECGICESYACPMGLQPRKINSMIKQELGKNKIKYQRTESRWEPNPLREDRKAPSARVAARAGVHKYADYDIEDLITDEPDSIRVPLKMHVGAPSVPVVSVGEYVKEGKLIAVPPEGALGAKIHAGITGQVTAVEGGTITISKKVRQ